MKTLVISVAIIVCVIAIAGLFFLGINLREDINEDNGNLNSEGLGLKPQTQENLEETDFKEPEEEIVELFPYSDVWPVEAQKLILDNVYNNLIIIDVSTSSKYNSGHIPRAINYPLSDGKFDSQINKLDKVKTYLIYSRFEGDSKTAAQKLSDAGFVNVNRLRGSYGYWVQSGYDVEK